MLKKINFVNLIGGVACFILAYAVASGTSGIVFPSVENEMFTFAIACTVGIFFLAAVKKD
jgi:hypothetical protein